MIPPYPFRSSRGQGRQQGSGKQWASFFATACIAASTVLSVSAVHQSLGTAAKFKSDRVLTNRASRESGESNGDKRRLKKNEISYEEVKRKMESKEPHDYETFEHFIADHSTHKCYQDSHRTPFNTQVRGVNLGGWMVLEPWITPSMFYQFLGAAEHEAGMDHYSFCEVLGPEEGNKQLRRHWDTWVTEEDIRILAEEMSVNSLRLPVGDFMYKPYGPYIGCVDGANEYVDQLLEWGTKYNVNILFDIHTMKDSQNGFDNSGQSRNVEWTSVVNTWPMGLTTFLHWPVRTAEWVGIFDRNNLTYPVINYDNIQHSLDVIQEIVDRYKSHPAVLGLEPVNEPWEFTPIDTLKQFYWDAYLIVKRGAADWKFIIHDSFRFDVDIWGGFLDGCPERAIDTHIYQAWQRPASRITFYDNACSQKQAIAKMEAAFGPVIVGEWSLATDNCVMWLNGFNDNEVGFPMLPCKFVPCTEPYMGKEQPGTPVDPGKPLQGPYGSGISGPSFGYCPVDRDWMVERSGDNRGGTDWAHAPPEANPNQDATDEVMTNLARRKLDAFSGIGHGYYFWNFKAELSEGQWDYMKAVKRGWIPGKGSLLAERISHACHREENGGYSCVVREDANEDGLRDGLKYCAWVENKDQSHIDGLEGDELRAEANIELSKFWKEHKVEGATCDFGGTAMLVLTNVTDGDDEFMDMDEWADDMVFAPAGYSNGSIIATLLIGIVGGGFIGFLIAMKTSPKFNVKVRKSLFPDNRNSKIFTSRNSLFGGEDMPLIGD